VAALNEALGRIKNTVNHQGKWHRRDKHEGVSATISSTPPIRKYADNRVGKRITHEGQHDGDTD
jgi:hypothetical protein